MTNLRVAIAGYGLVGQIRQQCIDRNESMSVVAVSDVIDHSALSRSCGPRYFSSAAEMLAEVELDVLFVCMPNYLAADSVIAGLNRGLHVFAEKPPGRSVGEVEAVRAVEAKCADQRLMYGFNHRYHDSVVEALRIVKSGDLGTVLDLRGIYGKSAILRYESGEWRSQQRFAGGGILLDQGIHMIDMMRLFGGEFNDVHSFVSNSFWGHDVEDNAYVLMKSTDNVVAMLHSSATQWRHRFQLDITLSAGAITLAGILTSSKSYGAETITVVYPSDEATGDPMEITTRYNQDLSWQREVDSFAGSILAGSEITAGSSSEALRTMQLVERVYNSDPHWRQVRETTTNPERHG